MNVVMVNGSTRRNGSTQAALDVVAEALSREGIRSETFWVGNAPVRDCTACRACRKLDNACTFGDDLVNPLIRSIQAADGLLLASPVYFSNVTGAMHSVLNRVFYSSARAFKGKAGAALVVARRAGTTAALESLFQYLHYCEMPIATSTYWPMIHGAQPEDIIKDEEGLQVLRNLGLNMAWLIKSIRAGREAGLQPPGSAYGARTNFIR